MAALNDSVVTPVTEVNAVSFNTSTATLSAAMPSSGPSANKPYLTAQVLATANCHISPFDKTPADATNTKSMPIPAWVPIVFKIRPGDKMSVIGNSASGTLFITIME